MKKTITKISAAIWLITGFASAQMNIAGNCKMHPGTTLTIKGDVACNGSFTDDGQSITLNGSITQKITGTVEPTFKNLVLSNSSGLTLENDARISNSLSLSSGALALNSRTLTIDNSSESAITRSSGYVVSEQTNNSAKISWNVATNTEWHEFPFATVSGAYIPFSVRAIEGNVGYITAATYPTAFNNTPLPTTPELVTIVGDSTGNDNSASAADRFWQVNKSVPSGIAGLRMTATPSEVGSLTMLQAQRWNGLYNHWDEPTSGQTRTQYSVTVPNVSLSGAWALTTQNAPFPVQLLSFSALPNGDQVNLKWLTVSETNSESFTVEKTQDLRLFTHVATLPSAGNSRDIRRYDAVDTNPFEGVSFYRLRQTDRDGSVTLSEVVQVVFTREQVFNVTIYPNPTTRENLGVLIEGKAEDIVHFSITSIQGMTHEFRRYRLKSDQEYVQLQLGPVFLPGTYTLHVKCNNKRYLRKFIIQ